MPIVTSLLQNFRDYAQGRLEGFTGREWLVEKVRAWLGRPDAPPFLLILGEPGIGKSAFAAHLWLDHGLPHAVHFCIAELGGTIAPLSFVESLNQQLKDNLTGFAEAFRQVQEERYADARRPIHVEAHVQTGDVAPGGEVTGVRVIQQIRDLPPEEALDFALRRPLQRMAENGALPQTILLVDALDEARTHFSHPNILDLLARAHDFPPPVRFILLSRPEVDILDAFREVPVEVIHAESEENRRDVTAYLHRAWEQAPDLRQKVQAWGAKWDAAAFAAHLGERSEWNFLYLRGVLPLIACGKVPDPAKLPAGLDGFHKYLLRTRIGEQEWRAWGADLLETMLAVQEPATLEHLTRLLGWEARPTHDRLLLISELLDPAALKQDRYWRYHWSLAEFVADRQRAGIWWCDLPAAHRRIAKIYRQEAAGDWRRLAALDGGYGLRHLAAHLAAAEAWDAFYALLTDFDFLEARCQATSVFDLEADYRLALAAWPPEDAERRGVLAAFEERLRLEEYHIARAPEWLFPALYNHLRWLDAPNGPLHRLCEAAAARRQGQNNVLPLLRSRLDPRPEPPLWLRSLEGHTDWVRAVAVSPDGCFIVSGSSDRTVKVWEAESGRLLRSLEGHTGGVNAVAVSPDGRFIVSGSDDHTVKVWETESGRLLRSLEGHTGGVNDVAVSPDGRFVVSGSDDRTVKVWDLESGRLLRSLNINLEWRLCPEPFRERLPDGRWRVVTGEATRIGILAAIGKVNAIVLTPDGRFIVGGADDCTVKVWEIETGRQTRSLEGHAGQVWAVTVNLDGRTIVSGSEDGTVRSWDMESRKGRVLFWENAAIRSLALSGDGRLLACGDAAGRVWIFDWVQGRSGELDYPDRDFNF